MAGIKPDDVMTIGILGIAAYAGYVVVTNPNALDFLKGPTSPGYTPSMTMTPTYTPPGGRRVGVTKTGGGGTTYTPPSGGGGGGSVTSGGSCGPTIYRATGRKCPIQTGTQSITYASSGKAAQSHRANANNCPFIAEEATIYLTWPSGCSGGGHDELAIKLWGPTHTDSTCCWCYTSAVPQGGSLAVGFGGEGNHPSTTTLQVTTAHVPYSPGRKIGIKGVIWPLSGGGAHQETWVDQGGRWQLMGTRNTPTCGKEHTETHSVGGSQEVEFRVDCSNVVYNCTDVSEIMPGVAAHAGYASYAAGLADINMPDWYVTGPEIGMIPLRYKPKRLAVSTPRQVPYGYPIRDLSNMCEH